MRYNSIEQPADTAGMKGTVQNAHIAFIPRRRVRGADAYLSYYLFVLGAHSAGLCGKLCGLCVQADRRQ